MFTQFWHWLHSTLGRGVAGFSALATLAWFLWPEPYWKVHPDALVSFLIALFTWLASLSPRLTRPASKHDKDLFEHFRGLFSESEKYFLEKHDFGNNFRWNAMEGTRELAEKWNGAEFEFDNEAVQKRFAKLVRVAQEFAHRLAHGSSIIQIQGEWPSVQRWASVRTTIERQGGDISAQTWERIGDLNARASSLIKLINEFIRFARIRLGE